MRCDLLMTLVAVIFAISRIAIVLNFCAVSFKQSVNA